MDSLVFVLRGINPYQTTRLALQKYPFPNLRSRKVLIKPNAARLALPGEGVTTHPGVVEATIDYLKEVGVQDILVGESCIFGVKAKEAFEMTGMKEVCENKKVQLIDFDQVDPVILMIPGGRVIKKLKIPSTLKEVDFIISIPVMKTHMHTQVTLSLKNMKGCLWRREKVRLHQLRCKEEITQGYKELDIAISEMGTVLFPHLAIIDGTVGMEGMGPAYGKKKEMGIVVIGQNGLSTDAVATRLMGLDPEGVPHLKLSSERGLGEITMDRISIEPKDFLQWENPFNPPPQRISIPFPDVTVHDEGSCSACLSTLLVFLQEHHTALDDYLLPDRKIHIGIGKHISGCPQGTILIGNCASRMKSKGIFVQGCPPVSSQILRTLGIPSRPTQDKVKGVS